MNYPDPQLYVILAVSVALLGITVARSDSLRGSTVGIVFPGLFVFCSWLHIVVSFSFSIEKLEPQDVLFHFSNLLLFMVSLVCIACSLRGREEGKKF